MAIANKRTRILFIHPKLTYGGAEVLRLDILKNWNLENYEVSLLCIEEIGPIGERIRKMGFPVYCLSRSAKPYNIMATLSLILFLLKNRFEIVQTSLFNANFHGRIAAFISRVPFVFSEEHSEHYQYNSAKFIPYILADRLLSMVTDRIICCCDSLKLDISRVEDIPEKKFITILSAIDLGDFRPQISPVDVRKRLGIGQNDVVLGNVSSMSLRKGHVYLLHAFSLVNQKFPSSRLVLLGSEDPGLKRVLQDLARELKVDDRVIFLGRQDRCEDYYGIMDIFVLSSLYEGIPLVILEAVKMNVPVVSTDAGGVREMIVDGKTGMIVPRRDPEALAESINVLIRDKQKRLEIAKAAGAGILENFKPSRYVRQLGDLYKAVCG